MDVHQNARTTPYSRMLIVTRLREGWRVSAVAQAMGIDPRTVRKWRDRFAAEGEAGLQDRSSRPHRSPTRLGAEAEAEIEELRRERLPGPCIARLARRPVSTVGAMLRRLGLGRLSRLDPKPPAIRYERERPGELIHIDTKKLGRIVRVGHRMTGDRTGSRNIRGIGWEHLHVAIDDASRLAYTELLPDDGKQSATAFLARALAWCGRHGIRVERVMTDNGSAYKSHAFRDALTQASIRHLRTRPYTPRTNGKAERFIQTSLREWAYATAYQTSALRAQALPAWLCTYNSHRPHSALGGHPPISRLTRDNVLGNDN
jgi:transposase InsO family protein